MKFMLIIFSTPTLFLATHQFSIRRMIYPSNKVNIDYVYLRLPQNKSSLKLLFRLFVVYLIIGEINEVGRKKIKTQIFLFVGVEKAVSRAKHFSSFPCLSLSSTWNETLIIKSKTFIDAASIRNPFTTMIIVSLTFFYRTGRVSVYFVFEKRFSRRTFW